MTGSTRRRAATVVAVAVLIVAAPVAARAASGTLHMETFDPSGGSARGFDIEMARVVPLTASSPDFRLGTNSITGHRQLLGVNGGSVTKFPSGTDFESMACPELRAAMYTPSILTGASAGQDPVAGTLYGARSRVDGYVKLRLVQVDLTSPNGLVFDFVTFSCSSDGTPPVISSSVDGPPGDNGWYVGITSVTWSVTDADSAVTSTSGCEPVTLIEDALAVPLTCTATSAGGASSSSVAVSIDATPPVVTYTGNAGSYGVDQQVHIECAASDGTSGIASGSCASVDAPAYTFDVGDNTLSASATDLAGNSASGATTFTVVVQASGMDALIDRFVADPGVAISLKQKIDNASAAPNDNARRGMLAAFRNELRAQTPESISEADAAILRELVDSL